MDNDRFVGEEQPKKRKRPWWYLHWMADPDDSDAQDGEIDMIANAGGGCATALCFWLAGLGGVSCLGTLISLRFVAKHLSPWGVALVLALSYAVFMLGLVVGSYSLAFKHLQRLLRQVKSLERRVARISRRLGVDEDSNET